MIRTELYALLAYFLFFPFALAQSFHPGNVPLIARQTYVDARVNSQNLLDISNSWPTVSTNGAVLGWAGYVKVDNTTYRWIGNSQAYNNATVLSMPVTEMYLTPTRTVFTMTAGTAMTFNITFLSPIEVRPIVASIAHHILIISQVGDWEKWSRPFGYVAIEATSQDGQAHDVQVYSDISGGTHHTNVSCGMLLTVAIEWLSGNRGSQITWALSSTSPNVIHNITLTSPQVYTDIAGQANWGAWYYATSAVRLTRLVMLRATS